MKITNKYNLPYPLYEALKGYGLTDETTFKISEGHISLSKLLMPIRQAILMARHDKELEEDASNRIRMLIGSAFHYVLEQGYVPNAIRETSMAMVISDWKIHMRLDCFYQGELSDYKMTSVWSHIFSSASDYEEQLNAYALAARREIGLDIERLSAIRIFGDWSEIKYKEDQRFCRDKGITPKYPPIPFSIVPVKLWSDGDTLKFLARRIWLFEANMELPDDELIDCMGKERWPKQSDWAVKKPNNKKAYRKFDSESKAYYFRDRLQNPDDYEVIYREGGYRRCEKYCSVRDICSQYAEMNP